MMITSNVYLLSALMAASGIFRDVAAQVPTRPPTRSPTTKKPVTRKPVAPAGTQPPNLQLMQFTVNRTKEQLVQALIASNGDVEFKDVVSTSNIGACGALYTGGHTLGNLMQRGPGPNYALETDEFGNYIPTTTPLVPDEGIILSSGDPHHFNWNDEDDLTKVFSESSVTTHPLLADLRKDVNLQSGRSNSFFDGCAISFKFRCTSDAYVPEVSFKFVFGSEEYYEYVDSAFNDAFGFYLNQKNIAKIPTTTTTSNIVSINNVNYNENKMYFNGNDPGTGWQEETPDAPYSEIVYPRIEADGFTNELTARGLPVTEGGGWNNMTLVISDVGDPLLDSWVVLEKSSFTCVRITSAPSVSSAPSDEPTLAPTTMNPTSKPTTSKPTSTPTSKPTTSKPTSTPTSTPTTSKPTSTPTSMPTTSKPTSKPTTSKPTSEPTSSPSVSSKPSGVPSSEPSVSSEPSSEPSSKPTTSKPTSKPTTSEPTSTPTSMPTTSKPTSKPTTSKPTSEPTSSPSVSSKPSSEPSSEPSVSSEPSSEPSSKPTTSKPTSKPTTSKPTSTPTSMPTTSKPTSNPTTSKPTSEPTSSPSVSSKPSSEPSSEPSVSSEPSSEPSSKPTTSKPTSTPTTSEPTSTPSSMPTTSKPTSTPSSTPTTSKPTSSPTLTTSKPTSAPSSAPSAAGKVGPKRVWYDEDGDGVEDPTEDPIPGVNVTLWCKNSNGAFIIIRTVTTDANGMYEFVGLQPSTCYISVPPQLNGCNHTFSPVVPGGNQIYPNGTSPLGNVTYNSVNDDWGVGMYCPVTIGDKVWEDLNGNGVQDADEPGKANILVTLLNAAGATVATTTTDAMGRYKFTGLPPGTYGVKFTLPPTYEFSPVYEVVSSPGGPAITQLDAVSSPIVVVSGAGPREGYIPAQELQAGANSTTFDAGMYIPVIVGGTVFDDKNANGIQDSGEPGLPGAKITATNTLTGESTTVFSNSTGGYSVSLMPGGYIAKIVPPSPDFVLSPLSIPGTANGNDFNPITNTTQEKLLRSGESGLGSFDAGFYSPVTIESTVWNDVNANGIFDQGEVGYTGAMTVTLYAVGSTVPFKSTATTANGYFKFVDIPPGAYEIVFSQPTAGSSFTLQNAGNNDLKDSDVDPNTGRAPLTVVSGVDISDITAGITSLPSIGPVKVFEDDDGDGILDPDEKGLPNVLVTLYNCVTNSPVATVLTDANGTYSFVGLNPGTYYISVDKDPDFKFSPVVVGGNQVSSSVDSPLSNKSPCITLTTGKNDKTLLCGMYEPANTGNKVWNDLNGDGIQQSDEPGIVDVTVRLYDKDGVVVGDTTTDVDGLYSFLDLSPGNYSVKFILPERFIFTVQPKSSFVSADREDVTSDADRVTGMTPVKFLKSGDSYYSFDAGMFIPVTVNGTTWHDLNADGFKQGNELGLASVAITLYDYNGDLVATTTTGANGVWKFEEMPPGSYHVKITPPTDPSGKVFALSPKPANVTSRADFDLITMKSTAKFFEGGSSSGGFFDAGLYLPATIGDRIWFDDTPNGIQEGDEASYDIPITVNLYDALGYKVKETTSTVTGFYQFTGVKPGSYVVEFILTDDDYKFTIPNAGDGASPDIDSDVMPSTGRTSLFTVTSGEVKNNIDAGVMDFGPYYPDWTNDLQVCTNDGYDPAWLEIQKVNYLYTNKEACCRQHFWWRMTECMANEEYKFYKNGDKCDSKIYFEDWETAGVSPWTETTLFNTIEECCANLFWYDYNGCVGRSPATFKFDFCVDIKGLPNPQDCQSADIFANVIEAAINEGAARVSGNVTSSTELDPTTTDTNITKIGSVSLSKVQGSTVCGGSLSGQTFTNELTGTVPDLSAAVNNTISVCGVITVEDKTCKDEACLREHYQSVKGELTNYVDGGGLTTSIRERATTRLPPVPELYNVIGVSASLETSNLVLPATIVGGLNLQFYRGSNLETCEQKAVFMATEVKYEKLYDCCRQHFSWDVAGCCSKGAGGCPETGVVASPPPVTVRYYPTWVAGQLCGSKPSDKIETWEQNYATRDECCEKHFNYGNELSICKAGTQRRKA